jgi:iron-sulfur cluster insertion protein
MINQIKLTENAQSKILDLIKDEDNPEVLCLRIFVTGGGCSGFQYGFSFDEIINDDDLIMKYDNNVKVVIDQISLQYLIDAEVDYQVSIDGERFTIKNPNAQTTCGCGSSFSI